MTLAYLVHLYMQWEGPVGGFALPSICLSYRTETLPYISPVSKIMLKLLNIY